MNHEYMIEFKVSVPKIEVHSKTKMAIKLVQFHFN